MPADSPLPPSVPMASPSPGVAWPTCHLVNGEQTLTVVEGRLTIIQGATVLFVAPLVCLSAVKLTATALEVQQYWPPAPASGTPLTTVPTARFTYTAAQREPLQQLVADFQTLVPQATATIMRPRHWVLDVVTTFVQQHRKAVTLVLLSLGVMLFSIVGAQFESPETPQGPTPPPRHVRPPVVKGVNPTDRAVMVWVPAGPFTMGSDAENHPEEHPQHTVTLSGYWVYKYEVTVAQYRRFCRATGRRMPKPPRWGWQDDHPMVSITWAEAAAYAAWAGAKLPTEAQWEKAARGPEGREYPWGDDWDPGRCPTEALQTHAVGAYPATTSYYGAADLAGNVREWCQDWYAQDAYAHQASSDPTGPASGTDRVLRDGSWVDVGLQDQQTYRGASRAPMPPTDACNFIGFRCVVTTHPPTP